MGMGKESMKRTLITTLAIAAVLITGIVHGIWTGRWEFTEEPGASVALLPNVGMELGDWQGQTLDAESRQLGDASGSLLRRYTNKWSGASVTVFLLCGRPGPVANPKARRRQASTLANQRDSSPMSSRAMD